MQLPQIAFEQLHQHGLGSDIASWVADRFIDEQTLPNLTLGRHATTFSVARTCTDYVRGAAQFQASTRRQMSSVVGDGLTR